jgi:hypothetical protein
MVPEAVSKWEEQWVVPTKGYWLRRLVCRLLGHRWFEEMAGPPSTSGWLRCERCRSRL